MSPNDLINNLIISAERCLDGRYAWPLVDLLLVRGTKYKYIMVPSLAWLVLRMIKANHNGDTQAELESGEEISQSDRREPRAQAQTERGGAPAGVQALVSFVLN